MNSQFLQFSEVPGKWDYQGLAAGIKNTCDFEYKILGAETDFSEAIFYCHGFGGTIDDCYEINHIASQHCPLIRVSPHSLRGLVETLAMPIGSFGDVCALLYNSRQAVVGIADKLGLRHFRIMGHSWGGFVSLLVGQFDRRCSRSLLLCASPDICDAVTRLGNMYSPSPLLTSLGHILAFNTVIDAQRAKTGAALHQTAWDVINPFRDVENPALEIFISNREEDQIMLPPNIQHFIDNFQGRAFSKVTASFIPDPGRFHHDMPYTLFKDSLNEFVS